MVTQLQRRGGTTAETAVMTGASREITIDTDKNTVVVHDGATVGGFPLALEANQMLAATTAEVNALSTSQLAALIPSSLSTLVAGSTPTGTEQIPAIQAGQLKALTAEQVAGTVLTTANFPVLTTAQISALTTADIMPINVGGVIKQVPPSQMIPIFSPSISYKVVTFSRNLADASGTQAVTGVGFQPRLIIFMSSSSGALGEASWGVYDGTTESTIVKSDVSGAGQIFSSTTEIIWLRDLGTAGNYQYMSSCTLDADGFTGTWVKTGTGTVAHTITAICYK